jgi:hypothetical protein
MDISISIDARKAFDSCVWWHAPILPALREAEIRGPWFQASLDKNV